MSVPLRFVPEEERPREKLMREGAHKLSDAELLAIILRTGIQGQSAVELAQALLHHCGERAADKQQPLAYLLELHPEDFKASQVLRGIGQVKLCQILAALHLGKRALAKPERIYDLSNPKAVADFLAARFSPHQEQFLAVLLTAKNHVISVETIFEGTLTATVVHPREVFRAAIKRSAHALVLAHNHPSGIPTPSREDHAVTRKMVEAGKQVGIDVLDHLVVGKHGQYVSFREKGLLEWS